MADGDDRPARRVLVVDDSAPIRAALERLLGADYVVVTAADGAEALRLIESGETFDAILCDLDMPRVDGVEVYRRLEQDAPELARHFVLVTGSAPRVRASGFPLAALVPILLKPFEVADLLATIAQVIGGG